MSSHIAEKRQTGDIFATAYFKPNMYFLIFVINIPL